MERQSVLLFKQKNRWGMTVLSVVLCILLLPLIGFSLLMPQVVTLLPVALLMMLGYAGPVSAVICITLITALVYFLFSGVGAACALVFLLPIVIASAVLVERRQTFSQSAGICAAVMFVSMQAVMLILYAVLGTDVVTALTELIREAFSTLGALADPMLAMMVQMGIIAAPEGFEAASEAAAIAFEPAVREEMINAIAFMLDGGLRLELPAQMLTGALTAGLFGQMLLRLGLRKRGLNVDYLPLRKWHVPKGWGRVLGGTLVAFYLGAMLLPDQMTSIFYVFSGLFDEIFILQGIATACYMLHKHGKGRGWQILVFIIGHFLIGTAAIFIGVGDQAADISRRREEMNSGNDNPYDPFSGLKNPFE